MALRIEKGLVSPEAAPAAAEKTIGGRQAEKTT